MSVWGPTKTTVASPRQAKKHLPDCQKLAQYCIKRPPSAFDIFNTSAHRRKKNAVPWAAQLSLLGPIGTLNRACEEGQKSKASWPYGIRHVLCRGSGGCDSHLRRFLLCTISIQRLLPRILYAITLPLHTNARQQPVDGNCAKARCNGRSLCCRHGGVSSVLFGNTLMTVAASAIVQPYAQPQVLP